MQLENKQLQLQVKDVTSDASQITVHARGIYLLAPESKQSKWGRGSISRRQVRVEHLLPLSLEADETQQRNKRRQGS